MNVDGAGDRRLAGGIVTGIALAAVVAVQGQETATPPTPASPPAVEFPGTPLASSEAWLYNPRERTRAATRALEQEQPDEAIAAATVAHDIDPEDQLGTFNLGTVRLLAGDASGAVEPLARVAEADSPLDVDAAYNLGSAHHQAQELDQAVLWYEETLRRDPSRVDAKINLELALEQRQQQQQDAGDQQQPDQQQSENDEQPSTEGEERPSPEPRTPEDGEQDQSEGPTQEEQQNPSQPDEQESPLPQFEPRPDMTAEEAASLLEAVEAMEREARDEMQPQARRAAPGDRDW